MDVGSFKSYLLFIKTCMLGQMKKFKNTQPNRSSSSSNPHSTHSKAQWAMKTLNQSSECKKKKNLTLLVIHVVTL